jgi:uncharacterized protein (DUF305 family)
MKRVLALTAALSAAFVFSACGGDDSTAPRSGGSPTTTASSTPPPAIPTVSKEHNIADVVFAQMMILHHRQAVEMSELASTRAGGPEVKKLATDIEQAQDPEIRTMSSWLTVWGEKVPVAGQEMDHSGHGGAMPGMMTKAQMARLKRLSGAGFDRMFLSMMKEHHRGAVQMAREEQKSGENAAAIALAKQIAQTQTAEIALIDRLIAQS